MKRKAETGREKLGETYYFPNWEIDDYRQALEIIESLDLNPFVAYQKIIAIDKPGKTDAYIEGLFRS